MDIKVTPSGLFGTIDAISSKSDAHRAMIAAALSDSQTEIRITSLSKDIMATASCIEALGGKVQIKDGFIVVMPVKQAIKGQTVLPCGESGSTARFILPVAAALCEKVVLTGEGRLPLRPFSQLCEQMRKNGSEIDSDNLPITVEKGLFSGLYELPGNVSSQYISGLLFALPLIDGDSEIRLTSPLESAAYVEMTLKTLADFNIHIIKTPWGYSIKGGQKYISMGKYTVEGDWSNAAFFLVAGALGGEVAVRGLNIKSLQADKEIVRILKTCRADISYKDGVLSAKGGSLAGFEVDACEIPDLVPVLAAFAAGCKGRSIIKNAARLRLKESDRLYTTERFISDLGGEIVQTEDGLIIEGIGSLRGGITEGFNDHRIVMAAAAASVICKHDVIIKGAQATEKSYPEFFSHFNSLGGKSDVL